MGARSVDRAASFGTRVRPRIEGGWSDLEDGHVGVPTGQEAEVVRVVCCDDSTAEADCGGYSESVDGHLAPGTCIGEEVPCDPCNPGAGGDDLCEPSSEQCVDRLVGTVSAVQLDKHCGGDPYRRVPAVRAAHRCAHALVTTRVLAGTGECGDCFAVED